MGDQEQAQAEARAQRGEEIEDFELGCRVECRDRLIENEQLGPSASARAIATRWRCPPDSSCG